jgi:hypothetical protein
MLTYVKWVEWRNLSTRILQRFRRNRTNEFSALALVGRGLFGLGLVLTAVVAMAPSAHAATGINKQINYQARLLNAAGATVPDGNYNLQFKIYQDGTGCVSSGSSPCGGTLKWTEEWLNNNSQGVTVTNGYFSVMLGAGSDSGALDTAVDFNQSSLWLSVNIGNTNLTCTPFSSCSGDGEMLPFTRFGAAPYALNSLAVGGIQASSLAQLGATQTFTGTNTLQPTTNITGAIIKQTSVGSPTADIFNVQTANGTNVLQVTGPSANNAAVTLQSVGGSNSLSLTAAGALNLTGNADSAIDLGSGHTLKLQFTNNGNITTGSGTLTDNGPLSVVGAVTLTAAGNALTMSTAPSASASQSLIDLGSAISSGNSSGTFIGINAANGYAGDLVNLQVNGTSKLNVTAAGDLRQGNGVLIYNTGATAVNTYTTSSTMTTTDLLLERIVVSSGASLTQTTPTAAQIVAAIPKAAVGYIFQWLMVNTAAGSKATLAGGTGVTVPAALNGVPASSQAPIVCRLTNVTGGSEAVTCY